MPRQPHSLCVPTALAQRIERLLYATESLLDIGTDARRAREDLIAINPMAFETASNQPINDETLAQAQRRYRRAP